MDFFDEFEDMFDRLSYRFNRPVKENQGFSVYTSEKGYIVVVNTLGIDRKDLSVNISKDKGNPYPVLHIKGECKLDNINFANNIDLRIRLKIDEDIKEVTYNCINGLTLVYLSVKHDEPEKIEAKYMDDASLNW